jgi:hypothetical protein
VVCRWVLERRREMFSHVAPLTARLGIAGATTSHDEPLPPAPAPPPPRPHIAVIMAFSPVWAGDHGVSDEIRG